MSTLSVSGIVTAAALLVSRILPVWPYGLAVVVPRAIMTVALPRIL